MEQKMTKLKKFHEPTDSDKRKIQEILRETGNDAIRTARICGVTKNAVNLTAAGPWKD